MEESVDSATDATEAAEQNKVHNQSGGCSIPVLEERLPSSNELVKEENVLSPLPRQFSLRMPSKARSSSLKTDLDKYHSVTDTYDLVIRFKNITVTVNSPEQSQSYETFGKKLLGCFFGIFRLLRKKSNPSPIKVVDDASGYIMPGSMTLVIGPTGSGKTTLLKVLAGHFHSSKQVKLEGDVVYNDSVLTPDLETRRPIAYITGLHNVHLPVLTVRETLEFAEECTRQLRPRALTSQVITCFAPDLLETANPFLEYVMEAFGLKYIENLMIGSGEDSLKDSAKARLTTAEIAMRTFSVLLYDQPTTAEDSLRLYDRLHNLLNTVIRIQECGLVTSLIQVSPEVFDLFERIILLSEGQIIYQGPRQCVEYYFSGLGFKRPSYVDISVFLQDIAAGAGTRYLTGGSSPVSIDQLVASYRASDFYMDVLRIVSTKEVIHAYWVEVVSEIELSIKDTNEGSAILVTGISDAEEVATDGAIRVGDEVTAIIALDGSFLYVKSGTPTEQRKKAKEVVDLVISKQSLRLQLERTVQKEGQACFKRRNGAFHLSNWLWSTRCLLKRQIKFTIRFKILLILRLIQILVLGLYAGSLFYHMGGKIDQVEMISMRTIGFISMMNLMLINLSQIPVHLLIHRPVFQKQRAQKFFPVSSYLAAHWLVNFPQSFIEALIYSMCTYFLASLSRRSSGEHYFQYLALLVLITYLGSSFVFLVSGIAAMLETAMALAGLFILVCLLFCGVILLPTVTPHYWRWMLYIVPLRWGNIIFSSTQIKGRYEEPCRSHVNFQFCLVFPRLTVGKAFLKFYDLEASGGKLVLSYGAIVIFIFALNVLTFIVYRKTRMPDLVPSPAKNQQQSLVQDQTSEHPDLSKIESGDVKSQQDSGWTSLALPVKPLVLTFYDLNLHVPKQRLLSHISGYARPGQMLALLGSTRAGKTTLLKCLAGRVGAGKLEGEILVNGIHLDDTCFHRISGFVEKLEAHQPYLTVRESLEFSANLRLDRQISPADRARHVDLVLELTGLSSVGNKLVGSFQQITSRTKEVTKKLTIAIELASNPSILFLDDPTSQLDGIGTRNVLHILRTVALNGRTLVLTLHHPSGETLSLFDRVLMLRQGEQVYFGPAGQNGSQMLQYFTNLPGVPAYDGKRSPMVFLLDILGGGMWKREPVTNFSLAYQNSPLYLTNVAELEGLRNQKDSEMKHVHSGYIAPLKTQVAMVFLRNGRFLWRNVKYTFSRLTGLIAIALVIGTMFLNIDLEKSKSMQSGTLIMYIQAILICATTANNVIPQLGTDRQVYIRESRARMYAPILYPLSWLLSEIPYILLATLVFVGIANGMAGIGVETFSMFIRYWLSIFLFTMVILCYGIFLACVTPAPLIATTLSAIFMSIWVSSSGISVPRNKIRFYKWVYWIDPFQYTMNILFPTAFFCDTKSPACLGCRIGQPCPGCSCKRIYDVERQLAALNRTQPVFVWDRLQLSRPIEKDRNHWDYLALCGMALLFAALAISSFRWLKHNRA